MFGLKLKTRKEKRGAKKEINDLGWNDIDVEDVSSNQDFDGESDTAYVGPAATETPKKSQTPTSTKTPSGGSIPAHGVKNIEVDWAAGEVDIKENPKGKIEWNVKGRTAKYKAYERRGTFRIELQGERDPQTGSINYEPEYASLLIPSGIKLSVTVISATASIDGISNKEMSLTTTSGDASFNDIITENLDIQSTSGDISIRKAQILALDCNSTSGDIEIGNTEVQTLDFHSTSGDGSFSLDYAENIAISTVSGDIFLDLPSVPMGNFDSVSGSLIVNGEYCGEGDEPEIEEADMDISVDVKTVSGDCQIRTRDS